MGQYKISFYSGIQIGLAIKYFPGEAVEIVLPFCTILIGLSFDAKGIRFFNLYYS